MKSIREFSAKNITAILEKELDLNILSTKFFLPYSPNPSSPYAISQLCEVEGIIIQVEVDE